MLLLGHFATLQWFQLLLPVVALITIRYIAAAVYNTFFHALRHVPGPPTAGQSAIWLGYHRSKFQMADAVREAHAKYGSVIRIAPNELHFSSPTVLKQIYSHSKDAPRKSAFYAAGKIIVHDNLFTFIDKEAYAERKKILSKCFSQHHLIQFVSGVRDLAGQLGVSIAHESKQNAGQVVDLYDWMIWFTFEAMYLMCFDRDADMVRTGIPHPVMNDMEASKKTFPLNAVFPALRRFGHMVPISAISKPYCAVLRWRAFTMQELLHAKSQPSKTSFLARLVDTEDEYLGRRLKDEEAAEEIMGLMFAGSGTTAMTMVYLLYEIAKLPALQDGLFEEVSSAMASQGDVPEYSQVNRLPVLQAVINETLRMHPAIVGAMPRETVQDMVLDGVAVPKGTVINMSNHVHHFDPKIYQSPFVFDPDRWLSSSASDTLRSAFTPFSLGPRNCIGQNLSMAEIQILVASLIWRFTFALTPAMMQADMTPLDFFNAEPRARMLKLVVKER